MLSKLRAYVKSYDGQTKLIYFLIEDENQLEKYNIIRDKICSDIKKEFGGEPLKTKIELCGDEVTDFCEVRLCLYIFSSNQLRFCSQKRWKILLCF